MPFYFFLQYYLFIIFIFPYNLNILTADNNVFKFLIFLSILKTLPLSFQKKDDMEIWKLAYLNQDFLVYLSCFFFWAKTSVLVVLICFHINIINSIEQSINILTISLAITVITRLIDIILNISTEKSYKDIILIIIIIPFLFPIFLWANYALIVVLIVPVFLDYILKEYINNK